MNLSPFWLSYLLIITLVRYLVLSPLVKPRAVGYLSAAIEQPTGFPSTRIDGGCGPETTFWILLFGHEIRRPNTAAASLKLLRQEDALVGESTRKVVSSAYTRSVQCCWPTVIPGRDVMCRRIQSMATQKSDGARTHPCRNPEVVSRWPDSFCPMRTRTAVPSWSALIRSRKIAGLRWNSKAKWCNK